MKKNITLKHNSRTKVKSILKWNFVILKHDISTKEKVLKLKIITLNVTLVQKNKNIFKIKKYYIKTH
jgi:hypothetical protein